MEKRREQAGDHASAEDLAIEAIAYANIKPFFDLMKLRMQANDLDSAVDLIERVADHGYFWALKAWDPAIAEDLAAERGDIDALQDLADLREEAGDTAGAEGLYRQAVDHGDPAALEELARRREQAGDTASADRMRRFGLRGSGEIATSLDFGSPIPDMSD